MKVERRDNHYVLTTGTAFGDISLTTIEALTLADTLLREADPDKWREQKALAFIWKHADSLQILELGAKTTDGLCAFCRFLAGGPNPPGPEPWMAEDWTPEADEPEELAPRLSKPIEDMSPDEYVATAREAGLRIGYLYSSSHPKPYEAVHMNAEGKVLHSGLRFDSPEAAKAFALSHAAWRAHKLKDGCVVMDATGPQPGMGEG